MKKDNLKFLMKMHTIEFINKYKVFIIAFICILGITIRLMYLDSAGGDYDGFLSDWCKYLKDNGGFGAISSVETDYNAIYLYFLALFSYIPIKTLYLIKFLSFFFDYLLAFGAYKLIKLIKGNDKKSESYAIIAFGCVLLMPTVIMNSSEWVQCDSIYVCFLFWSLYYMLTKKYNMCFIMYAVAITFKLQAIFLLPVYGIVFLKNREFSIFKFLWIPIVNFILYIPAVLLGKPVLSVFDAYLSQIGHYSYKTVLGYPNIYYFFPLDYTFLIKPGIILTISIVSISLIFILFTKGKLSNENIIEISVMLLFLIVYFLPEMHDRYGYAAEVLSVIYFIMLKRNYIVWLLINVNATITYDVFLHGVSEDIMIVLSLVQFFIVCYFVYMFLIKIFQSHIYNKNYVTQYSNDL